MKVFCSYLLLFFVFFLFPPFLSAQTVKQDSVPPQKTVKPKEAKKDRKIRINLPGIGKNRDSTEKPGLLLKAKELIESVEIPPIKDIIQAARSEEYTNEVELDSSIQAIEEVLFQLEETQNTQGVIELHNKRGSVHQIFGNKNLARESYQEVLKAAERKGDLEEMAEANFNIGNTYLAEERYRRAQSHLLEALGVYQGIYQRNNDQQVNEQLSLLNVNLGQCAQGLGQKTEALFYFDEAARLSEELEDKSVYVFKPN